jgi:hypothetical protein
MRRSKNLGREQTMSKTAKANSKLARASQCVAMIIAALLMIVPEAHAGLLDFLFGRQAPSVSQIAPIPAAGNISEQRRPLVARPVNERRRQIIASKPRSNIALCCKDGGDPMVALMSDPTLRDGDAVVTPRGVTIFEGRRGAPLHQPEDFVAVQKASSLSLGERLRISNIANNIEIQTDDAVRFVRPVGVNVDVATTSTSPAGGD